MPYRRYLAAFALLALGALVAQAESTPSPKSVEIVPGVAFVEVSDGKHTYRIEREQRPGAMLTNTYARTSRPSPPFFVQPFEAAPGVETYGELELLDFIREKQGVFVDARLRNWFVKSTIPTAVNIPFKLFLKPSAERDKILKDLGAIKRKDGSYDFAKVKTILLFCNGAWCGQSPTAIKALLKIGYPAQKMKYYRGGMQAWQLLGLTTIVPKKES